MTAMRGVFWINVHCDSDYQNKCEPTGCPTVCTYHDLSWKIPKLLVMLCIIYESELMRRLCKFVLFDALLIECKHSQNKQINITVHKKIQNSIRLCILVLSIKTPLPRTTMPTELRVRKTMNKSAQSQWMCFGLHG